MQAGEQVRAEMALRMGDDGAQAVTLEDLDSVLEPVVERPRRRLKQDPATAPAETDRRELGSVELRHPVGGHLTAGQDRCLDAG